MFSVDPNKSALSTHDEEATVALNTLSAEIPRAQEGGTPHKNESYCREENGCSYPENSSWGNWSTNVWHSDMYFGHDLATVDRTAIMYHPLDDPTEDLNFVLDSSSSPSSSSSCKENDWIDLNINVPPDVFKLNDDFFSTSSESSFIGSESAELQQQQQHSLPAVETASEAHQHNVEFEDEEIPIEKNRIKVNNQRKKSGRRKKSSYPCSQCQKSFPSQYYLRFHETSVHSKTAKYACDACDKSFTGVYYLRQHQRRMHSESRPFSCPSCPSSFSVKYDLVVHLRTHDKVKAYECKFCSKRYATGRALREHERTHTGEKPFECSECGKKFALPKTLRVHYRQHSGERPYLCSHCGRTFVQNSTLKNHVRTNHKM